MVDDLQRKDGNKTTKFGEGWWGREWGREGGVCIELGVELWSHLSKFSLGHKPLLCTKYLGDTVALYLVPFYSCGWALNPSPTPLAPLFFPLFVSFSNHFFHWVLNPHPSFLPRSPLHPKHIVANLLRIWSHSFPSWARLGGWKKWRKGVCIVAQNEMEHKKLHQTLQTPTHNPRLLYISPKRRKEIE